MTKIDAAVIWEWAKVIFVCGSLLIVFALGFPMAMDDLQSKLDRIAENYETGMKVR